MQFDLSDTRYSSCPGFALDANEGAIAISIKKSRNRYLRFSFVQVRLIAAYDKLDVLGNEIDTVSQLN
ncbi:hypothetical protein AU467_34980 [Mesorhizobium loti]|uniref:Uncharacterized protein n=1 Tax=Rhizobium loti TaxID=381 RepID=A0A101KWE6_RHILI|nr:hypothetical protein AU467_34980 [Mesorhizobium loti]